MGGSSPQLSLRNVGKVRRYYQRSHRISRGSPDSIFFIPRYWLNIRGGRHRWSYLEEDENEVYGFFTSLLAINAKSPSTIPEITPTIGPIISIINLGASGIGIVFIMAAS